MINLTDAISFRRSDVNMSVSIVKSNNTWLFTCRYLDPISKTYKRASRRGFKSKPDAILSEVKFIKEMESKPKRVLTLQDLLFLNYSKRTMRGKISKIRKLLTHYQDYNTIFSGYDKYQLSIKKKNQLMCLVMIHVL